MSAISDQSVYCMEESVAQTFRESSVFFLSIKPKHLEGGKGCSIKN